MTQEQEDEIYNSYDDAFSDAKYSDVDQHFLIHPETEVVGLILTKLCASYPARNYLPNRIKYYERACEFLKEELTEGLG